MNINNKNNIQFGQYIPSSLLFKCALNPPKYEDSKNLCQAIDNRFPGFVGFVGKARIYVTNIKNKNPEIANIINRIDKIQNPQTRQLEMQKAVKELGDFIDVNI